MRTIGAENKPQIVLTLHVRVVHVEQGQVIAIWNGKQSLRRVRLFTLIIRSKPYAGYWRVEISVHSEQKNDYGSYQIALQ